MSKEAAGEGESGTDEGDGLDGADVAGGLAEGKDPTEGGVAGTEARTGKT